MMTMLSQLAGLGSCKDLLTQLKTLDEKSPTEQSKFVGTACASDCEKSIVGALGSVVELKCDLDLQSINELKTNFMIKSLLSGKMYRTHS